MTKQIVAIGDNGGQLVSKLANNFDELYDIGRGIGYIIKPTDDISNNNWWTTMSAQYQTFTIIDNFDFAGSNVTMPAGIILIFNSGIWSNGTITGNLSNFYVFGHQQCFETNLTLAGTWIRDFIYPQYYGASSNLDVITYSNSSSQAIQKCLDSLFNVYIPGGCYYLDTGLFIRKPKQIFLAGKHHAEAGFNYDAAVAMIYTNQDIDVFTIQASYVDLIGGGIDLRNVNNFSHSGIRYDCTYTITGGKIDVDITGNLAELIAGTNTGNGILFDTVNATGHNETHYVSLNGTVTNFKYGLWVQGQNIAHPTIYISTLFTELTCNFCKTSFRYEMGHYSTIKGIAQDGFILAPAELEMPIVYNAATNIIVDVFMYDYDGLGVGSAPPYLHRVSLENHGNFTTVQNDTLRTRIFYDTMRLYVPLIPNSLVTGNRGLEYLVTKAQFGRMSFISRFDNQLAHADKRHVTSIKKFNSVALGIDFDIDLIETVGAETADVDIDHADKLFVPYGQFTDIWFRNLATKDTDFVEIVITLNSPKQIKRLLFAYSSVYTNFNRIQLIIWSGATPIVIERVPSVGMDSINIVDYFHETSGLYVDKIILRLIGAEEINKRLSINDYFMSTEIIESPLIDFGGGQTIYGNLALSGGIPKLLSQATYADNAAAKAGGLVVGDTYKTSTGILMVVYD